MKQFATLLMLLLLTSMANATDIVLTWDKPLEREDGSQTETIGRFNLYTTIDNVLQDVNEIPGDALSFQLSEVEAGNYTFQISTVERYDYLDKPTEYLEGALSDPISVNITDKIIAKASKMI